MKIITKDNKIVEGEPISEGLAKLVEDINNNDIGFTINYSHQRVAFIAYILANYDLTLKSAEDNIFVADFVLPEVVE